MKLLSKSILREVNKLRQNPNKVYFMEDDLGNEFCILTREQFNLILGDKE